MSDCRFGVSPVNYPDPNPDPGTPSPGIWWLCLVPLGVGLQNELEKVKIERLGL